MDLAGIFRATILIGGFIAVATGGIAAVAILQLLRGAGVDRRPPISRTSIVSRQHAIDARLRARYLQHHPIQTVGTPVLAEMPQPEAVDGADDVAASWADSQPAVLIGSFADEPAG
jgi:hypothetical protein